VSVAAFTPETVAVQVTGVPSGTGEVAEPCRVTTVCADIMDTTTKASRITLRKLKIFIAVSSTGNAG
jgi:hypothetical protein